jgi:hypothetical protein
VKKLLVIAALATATATQAAPIAGLFNTGTDASNVALVGGNGLADQHYTIASSTSGPSWTGATPVTYKHGLYLAEDADSRWISMTATGNPGNNTTVYRLTFDLTGFDFTTASITGSFGADNSGAVLLNGAATGFTSNGFGSLSDFTLTSGFVAGINTLDFSVTDFGPPGALRVDNLTGTVGEVPEPAMLGLFGLGAIGLAAARRRRA